MDKKRNIESVKKLHTLLKESIPNRFLNLSPYEFEEFIRQLFLDLGFGAEITKLTGDFGADILLRKGDRKIAVQVKRYDQNNKVGVQDINQIIGAKSYYGCDDCIFVTTSDFTDQGVKLARQANIQLWNWDRLNQEIRDVYLEGKSLYAFFGSELTGLEAPSPKSKPSDFEFTLDRIEEGASVHETGTKEEFEATIVFMKMKNNTNVKKTLGVVPIIIDVFGNQFQPAGSYTGSFKKGFIYPNASVPLNFCWRSSQIPKAKAIKQIIAPILLYQGGGSSATGLKEICLTIENNEIVAQEELKKTPIRSLQKQTKLMIAEEKKQPYLQLSADSVGKEAKFHTRYYKEEICFKVKLLGFNSLGKRLQSDTGKGIYESDGEILKLEIMLTNFSKKERSGWAIGRTIVLEDDEGYQFSAGETDMQKMTKNSYRFAGIVPNKPFQPKTPTRCSLLMEVPNASGKYAITVRNYPISN